MNVHLGKNHTCGPNEITKTIAAAERVLLFGSEDQSDQS